MDTATQHAVWRSRRATQPTMPPSQVTTFLGTCTCGALIVEKADGSCWDWRPIEELRGRIRTHHSCLDTLQAEMVKGQEKRDAEAVKVPAALQTTTQSIAGAAVKPIVSRTGIQL